MSGKGQRFKDEGYKIPKPLIDLHGIPIIEKVINNFPLTDKWIFTVNKEVYEHEIFINFYVKKMEWSGLLLDTDILVPSANKSCDGYIWNDIVHARNNSAKNSRFSSLLVEIFSILIFSMILLVSFYEFKETNFNILIKKFAL